MTILGAANEFMMNFFHKNKTKIFFTVLISFILFFSVVSLSLAVDLPNPLGTGDANKDPRIFIGRLIKGILGLSGSIALLMFVYGGLVYLTAQGESERIQRAKNTLIWATLGLAIIFGSYAFLSYVFKMFVTSGI